MQTAARRRLGLLFGDEKSSPIRWTSTLMLLFMHCQEAALSVCLFVGASCSQRFHFGFLVRQHFLFVRDKCASLLSGFDVRFFGVQN